MPKSAEAPSNYASTIGATSALLKEVMDFEGGENAHGVGILRDLGMVS